VARRRGRKAAGGGVEADLVESRLRRFVHVFRRVMTHEDSEAVHDVRVWSRRLQEGLDFAFPRPHSADVRAARKDVRRVRRSLGKWRNADVGLGLLDRRIARLPAGPRRDGWLVVRDFLRTKRAHEVTRARRRLRRRPAAKTAARLREALAPRRPGTPETRAAALHDRLRSGLAGWRAALAKARKSRDPAAAHAFRISTKRLRYRVELAVDLGETSLRPVLGWLKRVQHALGAWNDGNVLRHAAARALARPDVLVERPAAARALLGDLERGRARAAAELRKVLAAADRDAAATVLDRRVSS
jgi:CHAD domain-containing protein